DELLDAIGMSSGGAEHHVAAERRPEQEGAVELEGVEHVDDQLLTEPGQVGHRVESPAVRFAEPTPRAVDEHAPVIGHLRHETGPAGATVGVPVDEDERRTVAAPLPPPLRTDA